MTLVPAARAQSAPPVINAVVLLTPPLVMQKDGQLAGFSIDLWDAIAAKLKVQTKIQIVDTAKDVLAAMQSRQADLVLTPSVYTSERDMNFDFTYGVLNAGFLVMVPDKGGAAAENPLMDLVHLIFSPGLLLWLGVGLLLVIIPAHVFWLIDRGNEESISPSKSYFPGIFHALIWTASALVSQIQQLPARRFARVLALVWMFVGVVFVAFYTAQLTTNLTVQQITGLINGPDDLPGKQVGAFAGSAAVDYLNGIGASVVELPTVDAMTSALLAGRVDALVATAPALRYYETHDGAGKVKTVGNEIHKADLSYIVQLNSPLRRQINGALIALFQDGTYDKLYNKWFGVS